MKDEYDRPSLISLISDPLVKRFIGNSLEGRYEDAEMGGGKIRP